MKSCVHLYFKDEHPHCRRGCDICVKGRVCQEATLFTRKVVNKGWFLDYEE